MLLQLVLLEFSRSWVLKILLFASLGFALLPMPREWALRFALILAIVNPGLTLYLTGVGLLAKSATVRISERISTELNAAEERLPEAPVPPSSEPDEPGVSFEPGPDPAVRKALWDQILGSLRKVRSSLSAQCLAKSYELTRLLLAGTMEQLLRLMLEHFVSTLVLFILLPFAYFYGLVGLVKRLFLKN